ncbi:MAG: hypothetical protein WA825_17465, partial [Steroidobacteraceae bacterium]
MKKRKSKGNCPLVLIEWEDSRQPAGSWTRLEGFALGDICRCASVGWLVHDGARKKALAPN